jgi:hypothetical protein
LDVHTHTDMSLTSDQQDNAVPLSLKRHNAIAGEMYRQTRETRQSMSLHKRNKAQSKIFIPGTPEKLLSTVPLFDDQADQTDPTDTDIVIPETPQKTKMTLLEEEHAAFMQRKRLATEDPAESIYS